MVCPIHVCHELGQAPLEATLLRVRIGVDVVLPQRCVPFPSVIDRVLVVIITAPFQQTRIHVFGGGSLKNGFWQSCARSTSSKATSNCFPSFVLVSVIMLQKTRPCRSSNDITVVVASNGHSGGTEASMSHFVFDSRTSLSRPNVGESARAHPHSSPGRRSGCAHTGGLFTLLISFHTALACDSLRMVYVSELNDCPTARLDLLNGVYLTGSCAIASSFRVFVSICVIRTISLSANILHDFSRLYRRQQYRSLTSILLKSDFNNDFYAFKQANCSTRQMLKSDFNTAIPKSDLNNVWKRKSPKRRTARDLIGS